MVATVVVFKAMGTKIQQQNRILETIAATMAVHRRVLNFSLEAVAKTPLYLFSLCQ